MYSSPHYTPLPFCVLNKMILGGGIPNYFLGAKQQDIFSFLGQAASAEETRHLLEDQSKIRDNHVFPQTISSWLLIPQQPLDSFSQ